MLLEEVKKLSTQERLLYWIKERESIRERRLRGHGAPWTEDPILQKFKFCNVRRMDDKVSFWLNDNWYKPYKNHPNMVGAVCLARMFNLPSTLGVIQHLVFVEDEPDWQLIKTTINELNKDGPVFNGAYIVSTSGHKANKIDWVIDKYVKPAAHVIPDTTSMQETASRIGDCYGYSSFMAGQVVADLRWAITGTWEDKDYWAPLGPGSKRGLNRLYGYHHDQSHPEYKFREMLTKTITMLKKELPLRIKSRLEAHDYQNICCEIDKYERVLWDHGKPKQLYRPRTS